MVRGERTSLVRAGGVMAVILAGLAGCQGRGQAVPEGNATIDVAAPAGLSPGEIMQEAEQAKASGDYEKAMAMFRAVLAENPMATGAFLGMGGIHMVRKDYDKAEQDFARAARLEPRNFDAQYNHGLALQMLNRLQEAAKAYFRALVISPEDPKANANLATTYMQLGEPNNALGFAEKAVELDPANGAAHANLGTVYETVGRFEDAIKQYDAALELMEPTPQLMMNLINALSHENRYQEARNTAEVLIKLLPSANAYERLGWANFRLGEYAKSIEAYRQGVQLDPNHWPSLNGVGVNAMNTWLLSGKSDATAAREAVDAFRQSLKINSNQPKIMRLLTDYQFR